MTEKINSTIKIAIEKIKLGQTQIETALNFSEEPIALAETLRRQNIWPRVDFLKYIINQNLETTLFKPEMAAFLELKSKESLNFNRIAQFIKLLKREYKNPQDLTDKVDQLFNKNIGDFEMMVEYCFDKNNYKRLEDILELNDHPSTPMMHLFVKHLHNIKKENMEPFYKIITKFGHDVLDVPSRERRLCFYEVENDEDDLVSFEALEKLVIFINLIDGEKFKNKAFLKEMGKVTNYYFSEDTVNPDYLNLKTQLVSVVEKKQIVNMDLQGQKAIQNKKVL